MHYVYLLKSELDNGFYIGRTDAFERRMAEHRNGGVDSTRHRRPLSLIYFECYNDPARANEREIKLKQFGSAYTALLKRLGEK